MAKGGNNQRSNVSRFTKPYDASNSFVKKVALRVSDYLGGLFGSTVKTDDIHQGERAPFKGTDETTITHSYEKIDSGKQMGMPRCYDDLINDSSGKRLKIGTKRKFVPDLPISPIASSSSLFRSSVKHSYDVQNSEDFMASVAGPSGLQSQKYAPTSSMTSPPSANTNIKANGATDNHSDSSESTSGCSSLVPQSDRLSQSAFVSNSRKKILEEKLKYARQLKQGRTSMYLNRSIPVVNDATGSKRKPSFDVSVYGTPIFDKSSVREKMVNSPFYTGQTSYGGASAYRRPRTTLYNQQNGRPLFEKKEGMQIQVKPSHYGSTEDLSNMSHTAKRILEALEQFSTPISDAKRIPVNARIPPLERKRKRLDESIESIASSSTSQTANSSKGPLISGLNIPTVPDLIKLKRLEKIQDSTAAARQVAVQKQEYSLPTDVPPSKHTGKIVTKLKGKEKEVNFERPPEVNLPKIPLPISELPKFDFKLSSICTSNSDVSTFNKSVKTIVTNVESNEKAAEPSKTFKFSPPISLQAPENVKDSIHKSNFTFSVPLKADSKREKLENPVLSNLSNLMSAEALSKLKRKSTNDKANSTLGIEPAKELKTGSVTDLLRKTLESSKKSQNESASEQFKPINDTWECDRCLIRNIKDSKNCSGCKEPRNSVPSNKNVNIPLDAGPTESVPCNDSKHVNIVSGFGNKFKPPSNSWSCKECFVNNKSTAVKCIACENPKPDTSAVKEESQVKPMPVTSGFGDLFKKKTGQWDCSVCLIQNKESDAKCAACESPKPGVKVDKPEPPKFSFGIPAEASGFKFGIDKADIQSEKKTEFSTVVVTQPNGPNLQPESKTLGSVATSFGVFTFGIPPSEAKKDNELKQIADSSRTVQSEESQKTNCVETLQKTDVSNAVDVTTMGKTSESKMESADRNSESEVAQKVNDVPIGNVANNTFMMKTPLESQIKTNSVPVFSFGSSESLVKPQKAEEAITTSTSTFGSSLKIPERVSSVGMGFTFGQSSLSNSQTNMNTTKGNSDVCKSSSFPTFSFSAEMEPIKSSGIDVETTKITETTTAISIAPAATNPVTTANSVFGQSLFDSKIKLPFGGSASTNMPEFVIGVKASNPTDTSMSATNTSATFPTAAPVFSASNAFNGPVVPSGPPTSTTTTPFASNSTQGFSSNAEQGFRPTAEPSFTSSVSNFGNSSNQMSGFDLFNRPVNSFGSTPASGFGNNPTPTFGTPFGQPATAPEKPLAPFGFTESNCSTAVTATPAAPTTAPKVFTFGGAKTESKPPQFSGGFGQSSNTFTFGTPNPAQGNIFANFNQPKTANPFGNTNTTFGNPTQNSFGQSSAPASFGGNMPKFDFGSSSRTTQPFQFGATSKPQPSSAPATTFSTSVPQTFNFTGGQIPTFSAIPTSTSSNPQRKVVKAFRRTQR